MKYPRHFLSFHSVFYNRNTDGVLLRIFRIVSGGGSSNSSNWNSYKNDKSHTFFLWTMDFLMFLFSRYGKYFIRKSPQSGYWKTSKQKLTIKDKMIVDLKVQLTVTLRSMASYIRPIMVLSILYRLIDLNILFFPNLTLVSIHFVF